MHKSSYIEHDLLAIINDATSEEEILKAFAEDDVSISKGDASRIIAARKVTYNGRFTALEEIRRVVESLSFSRRLQWPFLPLQSLDYPVLLFPVRLETHIIDNDLCLRIYPDSASLDTHDPRLSLAEEEAGRVFLGIKTQRDVQQTKDAWRALAKQFGPRRAGWIVRVLTELGIRPYENHRETSLHRAPRLFANPHRFTAYVYRGKDLAYEKSGRPIRKELKLTSEFATTADLFDDESQWVKDFQQALSDGMAIKINLEAQDRPKALFSRIVVVGLYRTNARTGGNLLSKIVESHRYGQGMSFLSPGMQTNNTESNPSSLSSEERHERHFELEFKGHPRWNLLTDMPETAAQFLGKALGFGAKPDEFRHLDGADLEYQSAVKDFHTALWPATGGYYFQHLLPGILSPSEQDQLHRHFIELVRPGGPLPAIRIGRQPYGILPTSTLSDGLAVSRFGTGFEPSILDQDNKASAELAFDESCLALLIRLHSRFIARAHDPRCVPKVGRLDDVDKELLELLSMNPVSRGYWMRPFVDERLVSWLLVAFRSFAFGAGTPFPAFANDPLEWIRRWSAIWANRRTGDAGLVANLAGGQTSNLANTPLFKMLAWGDGSPLDEPPISMDRVAQGRALQRLCDGQSLRGDTSVSIDLMSRSLSLVAGTNQEQEVRDAICRLTRRDVLEFFNHAESAADIVKAVVGDRSAGAYGIRPKLAGRIIAQRDQRASKRFTALRQIDEISGIGKNTFNDILKTFGKKPPRVDDDRLVRETLDALTHRLDAWLTSFATKRLWSMRQKNANGIYLGAYGYVEGFEESGGAHSEGYIAAPSSAQAATAAVLNNAFLSHGTSPGDNPFKIDLSSNRVNKAENLLEGVRQGQPLGALLGYTFERELHESSLPGSANGGPVTVLDPLDRYIDAFREAFPLVAHKEVAKTVNEPAETVAARNVVDGVALIRAWEEKTKPQPVQGAPIAVQLNFEEALNQLVPGIASNDVLTIVSIIKKIQGELDAVSDLLLAEGVHQAVQGNFDRAGAALEASSGRVPPPEIEVIKTPVLGPSVGHKVCLLLDGDEIPDASENPRVLAEPRINQWFADILGPLELIGVEVQFETPDGATEADRLDINSATVQDLDNLPGIGEVRAVAIRNHIHMNGPFQRIKELEVINGIGPSIIEALRPLVRTGAPRVRLDWLGLDPVDILYMSTATPEGGTTEIEQRVGYFIRNEFALPAESAISLQDTSSVFFERTLQDAWEVASQAHSVIASGTPLLPAILTLPSEADAAIFTDSDFFEILARADSVLAASNQMKNDFIAAGSDAAIAGLLLSIARMGPGVPIPRSNEEPGLLAQKPLILKLISDRFNAAKGKRDDAVQAPNREAGIKLITESMKVLLGDGFVILPTFTHGDPAGFDLAFTNNQILGGQGEPRIHRWLAECAATHPLLENMDDLLLISNVWRGVPAGNPETHSLRVAQLPYHQDARWVALSDEEAAASGGSARQRGAVSLVLAGKPETLSGSPPNRMTGLLIDQWDERIPEKEIGATVAFQYDRPGSQAPQCLLLAVPEKRTDEKDYWTEEALADIVNDTIDLAKTRAVDPDGLREISPASSDFDLPGIFPFLYLPIDPDKPDWARAQGFDTIQDWLSHLGHNP